MRLALFLLALATALAQGEQNAVPTPRIKSSDRRVLAKAGDRDALQYYACRSVTGRAQWLESLMRADLKEIGGGFMVTIYRQLLDSDARSVATLRA